MHNNSIIRRPQQRFPNLQDDSVYTVYYYIRSLKTEKVSKATNLQGNATRVNLAKPASFYKHQTTATVGQPD